jgi:predicted nucleic acid-binding protein
MADQGRQLFIDTSILIAFFLRSTEKQAQIASQLSGKTVVTCNIVYHEYKRRVLKEAEYLIRVFRKYKKVEAVKDHIINELPPPQNRKRTICLDILERTLKGLSEEEQSERAISLLHLMIARGTRSIDNLVGKKIDTIHCALSSFQPKVVDCYRKYDFGPAKCKCTSDSCGIAKFMECNKDIVVGLLGFLANKREEFTEEMKEIHSFLERNQNNFSMAPDFNPCTKVGDLLIAMESREIEDFYTMNYKESRYFCEYFRQNLIVAYPNHEKSDKTFGQADLPWNFN